MMRKMNLELLIWGIIVFELGSISNILVKTFNGGAMPVNMISKAIRHAISFKGDLYTPTQALSKSGFVDTSINLRWLSDTLQIRFGINTFYFSVGDVLVLLGYLIFAISILNLFFEYDKQKAPKRPIINSQETE
jgi:hypothetical protein